MVFSRAIIHGIYALCHLSRQEHGSVVPASAVARAVGIPPQQAAKVMQFLSRAGVVRSARGRRGGYVLAKRPDQITLGEILDALSPSERDDGAVRRCVLAEGEPCTTQRELLKLQGRVRELISGESIATFVSSGCERVDARSVDEANPAAGSTSEKETRRVKRSAQSAKGQ